VVTLPRQRLRPNFVANRRCRNAHSHSEKLCRQRLYREVVCCCHRYHCRPTNNAISKQAGLSRIPSIEEMSLDTCLPGCWLLRGKSIRNKGPGASQAPRPTKAGGSDIYPGVFDVFDSLISTHIVPLEDQCFLQKPNEKIRRMSVIVDNSLPRTSSSRLEIAVD